MARRRRFKRMSPERGWLTIGLAGVVVYPSGEALANGWSGIIPLVGFDEIDNDDDGTLVTHDKSNWYFVRLLLDVWCHAVTTTDLQGSYHVREHQLLLATGQDEMWANLDPTGPFPVGQPFGLDYYSNVARILQTDYMLSQGNQASPHILTGGEWSVGEGTNAERWDTRSAFAHKSWDLSTRFSLRPKMSLRLVFGGSAQTTNNPVGWQATEQQYVGVHLRALLQKGRGR